MTNARERPIGDGSGITDLEPEVAEFCRIVARILARGTCRPLHNRDNCIQEPDDNTGRTTAD